jgi:2-hydroxy-3-keto-5-methylthiopentenyl-1-phosphate phosphatase
MMKLMGKNDIPFLVVSGGISELIEAHLEAIS